MWWLVGSVVTLLVGAVWYERHKIQTQLQAEGWTPTPLAPPPATPTAPAGVVPTTPAAGGGLQVTMAPGNLGTLAVPGTSGFPPPSVVLQVTPPNTANPNVGALLGVTSSNASVIDASHALINPGQPGQMTSSLSVMGAGTTIITVTWNDGTSAQTTSFTVNATA